MRLVIYAIGVLMVSLFSTSLAAGQIRVVGKLAHDKQATPGMTYAGSFDVVNTTDKPQQARVYQSDYLFFYDGTNHYDAPGSHARSNADWITFSPSLVTLPPGTSVPVSYTVTVPNPIAGVQPTGSYWSILMVEDVAPDAPESTLSDASEEPTLQTNVRFRYGLQIATHTETPASASFEILGGSIVEEAVGSRLLLVDLKNSGVSMINPTTWAEIYDQEGMMQGKKEAGLLRVYPGTSVRYRFDITDLPPGMYQALVMIDDGAAITAVEYALEL